MTATPQNPQQDQPPYDPPPGYGPDQQYAQQAYAPPGYPQDRTGTEKNWMNITSLVLSIAGLFTGGLSAIAGIVLGHLGLSAAKRGQADNRGLGLAGLITGYVVLAALIAVTVIIAIVLGFTINSLLDSCGGDSPAEWCSASTTTEAWAAVTGVTH